MWLLDWLLGDVVRYRAWRGGEWRSDVIPTDGDLSGFASSPEIVAWSRVRSLRERDV